MIEHGRVVKRSGFMRMNGVCVVLEETFDDVDVPEVMFGNEVLSSRTERRLISSWQSIDVESTIYWFRQRLGRMIEDGFSRYEPLPKIVLSWDKKKTKNRKR